MLAKDRLACIRAEALKLPADYRTPGSHTRRLVLANRSALCVIQGTAAKEIPYARGEHAVTLTAIFDWATEIW